MKKRKEIECLEVGFAERRLQFVSMPPRVCLLWAREPEESGITGSLVFPEQALFQFFCCEILWFFGCWVRTGATFFGAVLYALLQAVGQ